MPVKSICLCKVLMIEGTACERRRKALGILGLFEK